MQLKRNISETEKPKHYQEKSEKEKKKNSHFDGALRGTLLIDVIAEQIPPQNVLRSNRDQS